MSFELDKEVNAIKSNIRHEVDQALYGPIGILENPFRFTFYALASVSYTHLTLPTILRV